MGTAWASCDQKKRARAPFRHWAPRAYEFRPSKLLVTFASVMLPLVWKISTSVFPAGLLAVVVKVSDVPLPACVPDQVKVADVLPGRE